MYIDEIKKLLKDIEKIIQGDRRWIEKGDYEIREKLESVLENKSQKIQYYQEPILIQNDFILPQFQKKNNIIPNLVNNKIPTRKIIKLPSSLIHNNYIKEKNAEVDFEIKTGMTSKLKVQDINNKNIRNHGKLIIYNLADIYNANLDNIDGEVEIVIDKDTNFSGILPRGSTIEIREGHTLKLTKEQSERVKIKGQGHVVIKGVNSNFNLENLNIDKSRIKVNKEFMSQEEISKIPKDRYIDVPENETLYISAENANGRTIKGKGHIVITELDSNLNTDLSQILTDGGIFIVPNKLAKFTGKFNIKSKVNNSPINIKKDSRIINDDTSSYEKTLILKSGEIKRLTAAEANGMNITGGGSVIITDLDTNTNADLSKINTINGIIIEVKGSQTFNGSINKMAKFNLYRDSTLTISADKASGNTISGSGNVEVTELDKYEDANLGGIINTGEKIIKIENDSTIRGTLPKNSIIQVTKGKRLILTAEKASGNTISGSGNVEVTELDKYEDANLGGIINTGEKIIKIENDTTVRGTLPKNSIIQVNDKKQLTITGNQASNKDIRGKGKTTLTDLDKASEANLLGVTTTGGNILKIDSNTSFNGTVPGDYTVVGNPDVEFKHNDNIIQVNEVPSVESIRRKYSVNLDKLIDNINGLEEEVNLALGDNKDIIGQLNPKVEFKHNNIAQVNEVPSVESIRRKYSLDLNKLIDNVNGLEEEVNLALGDNPNIIASLGNFNF